MIDPLAEYAETDSVYTTPAWSNENPQLTPNDVTLNVLPCVRRGYKQWLSYADNTNTPTPTGFCLTTDDTYVAFGMPFQERSIFCYVDGREFYTSRNQSIKKATAGVLKSYCESGIWFPVDATERAPRPLIDEGVVAADEPLPSPLVREAVPHAGPYLNDKQWCQQALDEHGIEWLSEQLEINPGRLDLILRKHGFDGQTDVNNQYSKLVDEAWLREQYLEQGKTQAEIADELGCHPSTVNDAVVRHGLERGKAPKRYPKVYDETWFREQYLEQGKTQAEIADEVGCSKYVVSNAMHEHGIEPHYGNPDSDA